MRTIPLYAFADEAGASLETQIAAMKRNHLQGLELRGVDGENVSDLSPEKARAIRARLADEGLTVWSAGSPIGKIGVDDPFPSHLDKLRHTLDVARALGAENLRMFSFYIPSGDDPARYRDEVLERLSRMLEAAEGSGVRLCHENEKGIYGDVAARCLDLHRSLPALRGVFDPANFIQCGQDTAGAWALLKPHIFYMHIKDALPDGRVVPAGMGAGNLSAILRDFLAGGGAALTLEPHLRVFDGLAALEREGARTDIGDYAWPTGDAAFDAASDALKVILTELGYEGGDPA